MREIDTARADLQSQLRRKAKKKRAEAKVALAKPAKVVPPKKPEPDVLTEIRDSLATLLKRKAPSDVEFTVTKRAENGRVTSFKVTQR